MDFYPWVVFVHAASILLFFIAHGASMAVAFRLKQETDPARVRALLDVSRMSIGLFPSVAVIVGFLTGILAGFMGGWWGTLWIWISLVLLVVVAIAMTPLVAVRLNAMRTAAGIALKANEAPPAEDPDELRRLIDAWQPMPIAIGGLAAFLVILYLMLLKPF